MGNYSPLRYPGGKSALYPAISGIIKSNKIDIVLRGERKKGIWQIDVSVFEEAEQLSFFDK